MTNVKICGITNLNDALNSVEYGADALGFNFYKQSPRYISLDDARRIIDKLPPDVLKIGVFVNEPKESIVDTVRDVALDAVQLHGDERIDFIDSLVESNDFEVIKAIRVSSDFEPADAAVYSSHTILLDGFSRLEYGGTGETFDWNVAETVRKLVNRLYLAGGLSAENVRSAITAVRPYAVDACSLLESGPGTKDPDKLRRFIEEAKLA